MNKKVKIILITIVTLFISYSIVAQTGILKAYKNSTVANEPNLKINSRILVSNLVTPKIGDFICYNYEDKISAKQIRIHRLYGKENDVVEIINGILYVNKINIDKGIDHIHSYKTTKAEYSKIKEIEKISDDLFAYMDDTDDVIALLPDSIAEKYKITSKRIISEKGKKDTTIQEIYKNNWNKDNFGPLKIPNGKVFLIGDNRDNSEDCRYVGLINETDIVGTIVEY
jgi:signal peptidase I